MGEALVGHNRWVRCVAWSPDGMRIVSGGTDGTVRLWDVEKGAAVGEALVRHSGGVLRVAWSPDGKRIASGGLDHTVRVWEVESRRCLWTEDGWVVGDLSRLNFLLSKEGVQSRDERELKMLVVDGSVVHICGGHGTVLGTLEEEVECWEYSRACRSIAVGGRKGAINCWRLLD